MQTTPQCPDFDTTLTLSFSLGCPLLTNQFSRCSTTFVCIHLLPLVGRREALARSTARQLPAMQHSDDPTPGSHALPQWHLFTKHVQGVVGQSAGVVQPLALPVPPPALVLCNGLDKQQFRQQHAVALSEGPTPQQAAGRAAIEAGRQAYRHTGLQAIRKMQCEGQERNAMRCEDAVQG